MSQDIDFSTLTLMDTLDLAILVEEEARARYAEFVEQLRAHRTEDAARFFEVMAGNEEKHAQRLGERRRALFGDAPRSVDETLVFEVEAPDHSTVRAFMAPREALQVALDSEIKAYAFYDAALAQVTDDSVSELFVELRDEEQRHQELVEVEMAKLPDEPQFDADDFVDEPVGH